MALVRDQALVKSPTLSFRFPLYFHVVLKKQKI